jgi:hypothetical protein
VDSNLERVTQSKKDRYIESRLKEVEEEMFLEDDEEIDADGDRKKSLGGGEVEMKSIGDGGN